MQCRLLHGVDLDTKQYKVGPLDDRRDPRGSLYNALAIKCAALFRIISYSLSARC